MPEKYRIVLTYNIINANIKDSKLVPSLIKIKPGLKKIQNPFKTFY